LCQKEKRFFRSFTPKSKNKSRLIKATKKLLKSEVENTKAKYLFSKYCFANIGKSLLKAHSKNSMQFPKKSIK
jgi:hypothetical protein